MGVVDLDGVKTDLEGALGSIDKCLLEGLDVLFGHLLGCAVVVVECDS